MCQSGTSGHVYLPISHNNINNHTFVEVIVLSVYQVYNLGMKLKLKMCLLHLPKHQLMTSVNKKVCSTFHSFHKCSLSGAELKIVATAVRLF